MIKDNTMKEWKEIRLEDGNVAIDPMKIAWSKVKAGQPCNIAEAYQSAIDHH